MLKNPEKSTKLKRSIKFNNSTSIHGLLYGVLITLAGMGSIPATFAAPKIDAAVGHDDNPFRLADSFNPESGTYLDLGLRWKDKLDTGLYYDLNASGRMFVDEQKNGDLDNANNVRAKFHLGYEHKFKIFDRSTKAYVEAGYGISDKTYVSRLSGLIGKTGSTEIPDRYDYQFGEAVTGFTMRLNKKLRLGMYLEAHTRGYEDYTSVGLSNLDYTQYGIGTELRYRFGKANRLYAGLEQFRRDFDDKRQRTTTGSSITGTDLRYDISRLKFNYYFRPTDDFRVTFSSSYELRDDNGSGYYDYEQYRGTLLFRYAISEATAIRASVSYKELDYTARNQLTDLEDEDYSQEDGFTYRLTYQYDLPTSEDISLYASYRLDKIDSNTAEYVYDRQQVELGVKWLLFSKSIAN